VSDLPPTSGPHGVRIVIAHDLSSDADRAVDVIASAPWPPFTTVRIVTSTKGIGEAVSSFAGPREMRARARRVAASIALAHDHAAARLLPSGVKVQTGVLAGSPGKAVVRDAREFGADLVVAGAHRRSTISRWVLGSVSTEISENAHCSVLIARVESVARVLLGTDGSTAAEAAISAVVDWPIFGAAEVRVVTVAPPPSRSGAESISDDESLWASHEDLPGSGGRAVVSLERAFQRLSGAGRRVGSEVRLGDPAVEIIGAAHEWPADVVVVGSTGHSLVRRLLVGSVARSVLHGVPSSVMIVRPTGDRPSFSSSMG
jgi:nucleotide-binding universal stress UspA family protein